MQKLIMAISIIIAMFYALSAQAIGPERDTPTAILTLQQITTPSNPDSGYNRIYSKGDDKLYTLNSAGEEVELGSGGAGSGRLNLLEDPSFEDGVAEGSCSGCTASEESTEVLATVNNAKSLEMAYSAATGCYTVTKTTSSQYSPTQMAASCFIKTGAIDVTFEAMVNGASVLSKEVSSSDSWKEYTHSFVGGATSVGYRVCANSSITDSIFVDECFVGAKDVLNKVGYDTGWIDDGVITISATTTPPTKGTTSVDRVLYRRNGKTLIAKYDFRITDSSGTTGSGDYLFSLPNGLSVDTDILPFDATNPTVTIGMGHVGNNGNALSAATHTARAALYSATQFKILRTTASVGTQEIIGSGLFALNSTTAFSLTIEVPIAGWSATFDSISDIGGGSNIRLDTANGYGSTATKIRRFTNERVNIGSGLNCVDSSTNGFSCTVLRSGFYFVSYSDVFGSAGNIGISLNASSLTTDIQALTSSEILGVATSGTGDFYVSTSSVTWLWSGDVVRPHTNGVATGAGGKSTFSMVGLLDQINAILKDVVMSPNSSNGKPVSCSASISATDVVTNEVGDCIDSVLSTSTGIYVVTFNSGFFGSGTVPSCFFQFVNSGLSGRNINFDKAATSSSGTTYRTLNYTSSTLSDEPVEIFCRGVAP